MKLEVLREPSTAQSTPGSLFVDGVLECVTLEDVVREIPGQPVEDWKIMDATAIPVGTYDVVITRSQRFKRDLPLLLAVPGFEGIRIHPGNTAADTSGCILVGQTRSADFIGSSRIAFAALFEKIRVALDAEQPVRITIHAAR